MAPLINYASTEVLVLDVPSNKIHELGHVLWSVTVDLFHHSDHWTLTCLLEKNGHWENSYRVVSIKNSTTIDQLFDAERLTEPPEETKDVETIFGIAIGNSGASVPRFEKYASQSNSRTLMRIASNQSQSSYVLLLSDYGDRNTAQVLYSGKKNAEHARVLLKSFYALWERLCSPIFDSRRPVRELDVLTHEDVRIFELVNSGRLLRQNQCFQDIVLEHSRRNPGEYAIRAWDGNLTYSQLDDHASRIATMLRSAGIVEVFVPIDPKNPASRTNSIFLQISAKMYFTNLRPQMRRKLNPSIACVDSFEEIVQRQEPGPLAASRPDALATCFFTSGSTGKPKGVVHDHTAICTGALEILGPFHMDNRTSCLNFTSPGFDVSISEIFATLYAGGCVCVPSEQGKLNDLNGEMRALGVTHAFLTPSIASQVKPNEVPTLEYIILGGEPLARTTLESLHDSVHLINSYGCTESGLWDTASERLTLESSPSNVGQSTGPRIWIVHPSNPNNLLPFGTVGEVLVESHCLARGYIGDKPAKSGYIPTPDWRYELLSTLDHGRFYLTGDLGSYNPDGSINLHGRKDTQAKVRGQRIELGEIEHQYRAILPSSRIVAEVVPAGNDKTLAVFLESTTKNAGDTEPAVCLDSVSIKSAQAARLAATPALSAALPPYMVPKIYIPITSVPLTMSGKTDRRRLRELAQTITPAQLATINGVHEEKEQPCNERELLLQEAWAAVFQVMPTRIGIHDHFLKIGGDSIHAMKAVAAARERQLSITVGDILENPTIASLAKIARRLSVSLPTRIPLQGAFPTEQFMRQLGTRA
ncbi:Nonribosomal peptide synthetase 9 [Fusarium piperis]|uniref:Nonribosomal peptide synthetase 9 n=1 Tax=Fusarium piperis TaxID=1435070 RepID=A0A9W8T9R8_9HYPO|nr:Nonribosomal peptide synthetase 9 [Fusarium piperis]